MGRRQQNIRRALEADGATPEEISEVLKEVDAEEGERDPLERARSAGVPRLYLGVGFGDIEEDGRKKAIASAKRWAEAFEPRRQAWSAGVLPGLYLWSDGDASDDETGFGTGKTRIAAAAAQHLLGNGAWVRWVDVSRQMTNLNLSYKNPMYERAAARLREPNPGEVIILDDIDKQPPTDRNIQPIFALISDCVNNEVPLLITANRCADDLQADWGERFGHAAASRIIGHCLDVEVSGRDRRLDPA